MLNKTINNKKILGGDLIKKYSFTRVIKNYLAFGTIFIALAAWYGGFAPVVVYSAITLLVIFKPKQLEDNIDDLESGKYKVKLKSPYKLIDFYTKYGVVANLSI